MCRAFKKNMEVDADEAQIGLEETTAPSPAPAPAPQAEDKNMTNQQIEQPQSAPQQMSQPQMMYQQPVNVQPAQFTPFSGEFPAQFAKENIDLIMDVPLEVTVELGRTSKSISEILDFAPGTIIELNRIAGEPIDVLVNGKYVAKGEVVVIEESFGVRITEIVK
jgi:flagellar motor switch protein FliN/FliY